MFNSGDKNYLFARCLYALCAGKITGQRLYCTLAFLMVSFFINVEAQTLNNAGFEGTYNQIAAPTIATCGGASPAIISGEVGNGWVDESEWADVDAVYSRETVNPHTGASAQKVDVRAVRCGGVQMLQSFNIQKDKVYTAGIWIKGTPGKRVNLTVMQRGAPYKVYFDKAIALTGDWKEEKVTSYSTEDAEARFQISTNTDGVFYVDDASLVSRAGTPAPAPPTAAIPASFFGMHANYYAFAQMTNGGFERPFRDAASDRATITGSLANWWSDSSSWADVSVSYAEDTDNPHSGTTSQKVDVQAVKSGSVQITQQFFLRRGAKYGASVWLRGRNGMRVNFLLRQNASPYTFYALQTATLNGNWQQIQIAGSVSEKDTTVLMIETSDTGTFWIDDAVLTNSSGQPVTESFPPVGFKSLRLWDAQTTWSLLEPQKGKWDFTILDRFVNEAVARNQNVTLVLGQSPTWASARPGDVSYNGKGAPAEPRNIQDWRDYVSTVATRYRGKIKFYEIWNEPNDRTFYTGSIPKMVELTNEAVAVLKSIDPSNTVISPPPYVESWLTDFFAAGGAKNVDVIGYHSYSTPPEEFGRTLANVRLIMQENGLLGVKPFWNTEGATGDQNTEENLSVAYLARAYLVNLLYGAEQYNWYAWGRDRDFFINTVQPDNFTPTAAGNAFGVIQQWLIGATIRNFTTVDNNWRVELTLANGTRGWIIWNPNTTVNYPLPVDWNAQTKRDLYGVSTSIASSTSVSVNAVPILIESAPAVNTFTDGIYKITALHSGKSLDVSAYGANDGAIIHQWEYFGQTNQKWSIRREPDGSYRLTAVHSGKVLDAKGASTSDGTIIQQYGWNNSCAQKWRFENRSDGAKTIRSTCSNKVLDVSGVSQENGAPLQLWTSGGDGSRNQAFVFEGISN